MAETTTVKFTVLGGDAAVPVIEGVGFEGDLGPVRRSSTVEFGGDFQA